jgi:rhodanese-related sulfurtransferase/DNA-binding transcriptional ArsR family regulator
VEQRERKDDLFGRLAVVGKAFASAKRLELIEVLGQGERSVEALARETGLGLSTASAHLQVLKLSGLVLTRREGTRIHYRLAGDDVVALFASMRTVAQHHSADVDKALGSYFGDTGLGDVEEVTRDQVLELLAAGGATVVDVRPVEEYAAGHIPGARSVPFGDLAAQAAELRGLRDVVAYCRGAYCVMAHDAVRLLAAAGVPARRLQDGMLEWRAAGLPVEASA